MSFQSFTSSQVLLRECLRSTKLFELEPYQEENVRDMMHELELLTREEADLDTVHQAIVNRMNRILAIYHMHRLKLITRTTFEAPSLSPKIFANMSIREQEFHRQLQDALLEHQRSINSITLLGPVEPPKDLLIQIRVKEDCGLIQTEQGAILLNSGSTHFVRRTDVFHLIGQGLVEHIR